MEFRVLLLLVLSTLFGVGLLGQEKPKTSKPAVQKIDVEKDVSLEVLDWGGTGRSLVLLTGLGDDAHIFRQLRAHTYD